MMYEGFFSRKKLNIENFKIKARLVKSLMEEEIPSGRK